MTEAKERTKESVVQWFAGFYEGEGWVSNDISNNNAIRLGIAQNDPTPLILGQTFWGGVIRKRTRKSPASNKICEGYEWNLCHKLAVVFINDIKPYMLIPYKINQLKAVLETMNVKLTRKFACPICKREYASPSGRRRHVRTFHEKPDASGELLLQENQIAGTS